MEEKIVKQIQRKNKNYFKNGMIFYMKKTSFFVCLIFLIISIILLVVYLAVDISAKWGAVILAVSSGFLTGVTVALTFEIINGKKIIKQKTREYNNLIEKINEQYICLASHNHNLDEFLVNVLVLQNKQTQEQIKNLTNDERNKIVKQIIDHYEGHCEKIPNANRILKSILIDFIDPLKKLNELLPLFQQRYAILLTKKEKSKLQSLIWSAQCNKKYVDGVYKDTFVITIDPIKRIIIDAKKVLIEDSFFFALLMPEFVKTKSRLKQKNSNH